MELKFPFGLRHDNRLPPIRIPSTYMREMVDSEQEVVPQTQEVKFGGNVCPAPGEEAFEFAVAFQYPKSAFHLNGAVDPEHNSSFTCNILL